MPCYDPETHDRPVRLEAKVHKLTAFLCELCGKIEVSPGCLNDQLSLSTELIEWWTKHKAHDQHISDIKKKAEDHGRHTLTPKEEGDLIFSDDVSMEDGECSVHIINPMTQEEWEKSMQESGEKMRKAQEDFLRDNYIKAASRRIELP